MARAGVFACFALSCLFGCDGAVVNLGNSESLVAGGDSGSAGAAVAGGGTQGGNGGTVEWVRSDEPVLVEEGYSLSNPTFPSGGDYMLFTRQQRGVERSYVWRAERAGDGYLADAALSFGSDPYGAVNPALALSGEELWFGMFVDEAATDVFTATREGDGWSAPQAVAELSSSADDSPRPPGLNGTVMPLSSKRRGGDFYQIYLVRRDAVGTPWGTPQQDLLGAVNEPDSHSVDGFLTHDGLSLYFASTRDNPKAADLYRAQRSTPSEPFGAPEPLRGLQGGGDERDPWLSEDGWLYYTSNRSGAYAIYRARRATR